MIFIILFLISAEFLINIVYPLPLLLFVLILYNRLKCFKILHFNSSLNLLTSEGIHQLILFFVVLAIPFHFATGVLRSIYFLDFCRIVLSIFLSYLIYSAVYSHVFKRRLTSERSFQLLCVLMLFICFLEILPGFGPIIHDFYESVTVHFAGETSLAIRSVSRNLGIFGRRPLFFTSEPSHVAKLSINLTFVLILFQIYSRKLNFIIPLVFSVFISFIVQSPIAYISILLVLLSYFLFSSSNFPRLIMLGILPIGFISFIKSLFSTRSDFLLLGADTRTIIAYAWQSSGIIRTIVPYLLCVDILKTKFVFFGLGLDARYFSLVNFTWLSSLPEYGVIGNNSLLKVFILYGFYGYIIIFVLFYFMYKSLSSWRLFGLFSFYIFAFSFATGSIDVYLFPSSMAVLFGVNNALDRSLQLTSSGLK